MASGAVSYRCVAVATGGCEMCVCVRVKREGVKTRGSAKTYILPQAPPTTRTLLLPELG